MKERGPGGFNPENKLTGQGQNPYAGGGGKYMPEGTGGGPDNPQMDKSSHYGEIVHPTTGRVINTEYQNPQSGDLDPRNPDQPFTTEEETDRIKQALIEKYRREHNEEPNVDALRVIDMVSRIPGLNPSTYNPPEENQGRGSIQSPQMPQRQEAPREQNRVSGTLPTREELRATIYPDKDDAYIDNVIKEIAEEQERQKRNGPEARPSPEEIRRQEELEDQNERLYGETKITSVQVLAKEIMRYEPTTGYQTGGEFELINEQGEFQQQNFLRWVRQRMMHWHDESPDAVYEFDKQVNLQRNYSNITIQMMVNNPERYFKDATKTRINERGEEEALVYQDLVDEIKRETWLFGESRKFDIEYQQAMGSDEDLAKTLLKNYYLNTFTKTIWDRSSLYWILNMAQNFEGDETKEAKVGQALNTAYLAYYNLADREMLANILGEDAPLIHADGVKAKIKELAEKKGMTPEEFIEPSLWKGLTDAKPGKVIDFINIFNLPGKNSRAMDVTRALIKDSLIEKFDLYIRDKDGNYVYDTITDEETGEKKQVKRVDTLNLDFAETYANSMARWTGAGARNDTSSIGYDAWTKLQDTDDYRLKQPEWTRGGGFGNPYTIRVLKQLGRDLFTATFTETIDPNKKGEYKNKTPLQVLMEMEKLGVDDYKDYKKANSQLIFPQNTMRSFTIDHFNRVFGIYNQVMKAEEIKLDKFTKYDYINGLQFERGPFEEALKEKFFKPMRYAYSTYAMLDYTQEVRAKVTVKEKNEDGKEEKVVKFKTVRMAEAMFGREVLHIPQFWNDPKNPPKIDSDDWAEHINWEKVNTRDGKVYIWRQVALTRLAAELYSHRDRHSTDPKYNLLYFEDIIKALEELPSDIAGDEFNLQSNKEVGRFFSKQDINWLREKASAERWRLYRNQTLSDIGGGFFKGLGEAIKLSAKGITKV